MRSAVPPDLTMTNIVDVPKPQMIDGERRGLFSCVCLWRYHSTVLLYGKAVEAGGESIANLPENHQPFLFCAGRSIGIRKSSVLLTPKAPFRSLITDRHDQVHRRLTLKVPHAFGPLLTDIHSHFGHNLNR